MTSVTGVFFLDNLAGAFAPVPIQTLTTFGIVILTLFLGSIAIVLAILIAVFVTSFCSSSRRGADGNVAKKFDLATSFGAVAFFVGVVWTPIATFLSQARSVAAAIWSYVLAMRYAILFVFIFSAIAIPWSTSHAEIWAAAARVWSLTVVPLYRVVPLYLMLGVEWVIEVPGPWINALVVRIPSQLISGLFFDVATCSRDTFTLFFIKLVETSIVFMDAWIAWGGTGSDMVLTTPDFAPFGQALAETIGVLNTFFACFCASSEVLTAPLFQAIEEGNPHVINTPENPPNFACAINASVNVFIAAFNDVRRPIIDIVEGVEEGKDFIDVLRGTRASFVGTLDTGKNIVNCTLGTIDNGIQQYWFEILTENPNAAAPDRMFSCLTGWLWRWPEAIKYGTNILFHLESTFTTFNGQINLRFDNVTEVLRDFVLCFCRLFLWVADTFRFIADTIVEDSGRCDQISGDDLGPEIGGCIFYIISAFFDFVCCVIRVVFEFVVQAISLLWEWVIGTFYSLVQRSIDQVVDDPVDVTICPGFGMIEPENEFYCSLPKSGRGISDYMLFQMGKRSEFVGFEICPPEICAVPSCRTNQDCIENPLFGVSAICQPGRNRCYESPSSCKEFPRKSAPTDCIFTAPDPPPFGEVTCFLGTCLNITCPSGEGQTLAPVSFDCDCQCEENLWRNVLLLVNDAATCIGQFLIDFLGRRIAEFIACFITSFVAVTVEAVLILVDLVSQLEVLFSKPSEVDIPLTEFDRAFRGVCFCIVDGIRSFATSENKAAIFIAEQIALFFTCICDAVRLITIAIILGGSEIISMLVELDEPGFTTENFEIALESFVRAIIILVGSIFNLLAFIVGAFEVAITDEFEAAQAFADVATAFKEGSVIIAEALIDLVIIFAECIGGLLGFIIQLIKCLAKGDCTGDDNPLPFLIPCLELIGELVLRIIDFFCEGCVEKFLCVIQKAACFLGLAPEPPDPPISTCTSQEECEDLNIVCFLEKAFCFFGIEIDIGCDQPCGVSSFVCWGFGADCTIDLIFLEVVQTFENFINSMAREIDKILDDICDALSIPAGACPSVGRATEAANFPFFTKNPPPVECCTADGSASISPGNFDFSSPCADQSYIKFTYKFAGSQTLKPNRVCENIEGFGCYAYFSSNFSVLLEMAPLNTLCCNGDPGVPVEDQDDLCCDAEVSFCFTLMGKKRQVSQNITSADYEREVYMSTRRDMAQIVYNKVASSPTGPFAKKLAVARQQQSHRIMTTQRFFQALEDENITETAFVRYCMNNVGSVVSDLATNDWPPVATLAANDTVSSPDKFVSSTCMSFLDTFVRHPLVSRNLSNRTTIITQWRTNTLNLPVPHPNMGISKLFEDVYFETLVWPLTYTLSLTFRTFKLVAEYGSRNTISRIQTADNVLDHPPITLGVLGGPIYQTQARHATVNHLPSAILADWIMPMTGAFSRGGHQAVRAFRGTQLDANATAEQRLAFEQQTTKRKRHATNIIHLLNVTANIGSILIERDAIGRTVNVIQSMGYATIARMQAARAPRLEYLMVGSEILMQPVTPVSALKRHYRAQQLGLTKRSAEEVALEEEVSENEFTSFAGRVRAKLNRRGNALLRKALFGTEDMELARSRVAARLLNDNDCDPRASPFECCPEQTTCTNCSVLDRVFWAGQDSFDAILEYSGGDYLTRFSPCFVENARSVNNMFIDPARQCPDAICEMPECTTDAECAISFGNPPAVCNPTLGRCIAESDPQCLGEEGKTCFENAGANACTVGQCVAGVCISPTPFECNCKCPDTFLTVNKTVPFLLTRLADLEVPCILNLTCLADVLITGDNITAGIPDDHRFVGSFVNRKSNNGTDESNIDLQFLATLNALSDGLGTNITRAIDDLTFFVTDRLGEAAGTVFDNFLNEFVFCDYRDDWFCPLAEGSPTAPECCSDRCEVRKQGTTLFNGFIFALLVLIVPLLIIGLCPICPVPSGLFTALWILAAIPVTFMFAYGGGLLCYTPGPLLLVLPVYGAIVSLVMIVLRSVCFGSAGAAFVTVFGGLFSVIMLILMYVSFLPGLSVCTGADLYNVASEVGPSCFWIPIEMVDRTLEGATAPCGGFLDTGIAPLPSLISCATTDRLTETRFRDGLDNILYIVEQISPGTNARLANETATGAFSWIQPYAVAHTTEAHNASEPPVLTRTCFYVTFLSIFLAFIVVLFQLILLLLISAAILLVLSTVLIPMVAAAYASWLMLEQIRSGWIERSSTGTDDAEG